MNLTLSNIKELKRTSQNPLFKRACKYVEDEWSNYSDKKNIFTDVLYYGCQSGMVSFLIWYSDTTAFYKKYREEINTMLYEEMCACGINAIPELFGNRWDSEDPLATDDFNQNLLAWFGFEEALRRVGHNFETLEDRI